MARRLLPRLIEALDRADMQVPHTPQHDDAMDDVWALVAEYHASERLGGRRPIGDESDLRHGTLNGYMNLRCRCERCTAARTEHQRERRAS